MEIQSTPDGSAPDWVANDQDTNPEDLSPQADLLVEGDADVPAQIMDGAGDTSADGPTTTTDATPASDDGVCAPPTNDVGGDDLPVQSDQGTTSSSPYQGGWPFNPNKSEIADPGWSSVPAQGTVLPHFVGVDQYGDMVDLYDFAGQGKLVVLDLGTIYCAPCKGLAAFFATGDPCHMDPYLWWNDSYEGVLDMIESGEILWVTILFSKGGPTTEQVVHGWHEEFPSEDIAVLADANAELATYLDITGMPQILVLNEDMELLIYNTAGPKAGMDYLVNLNP